MITQVYGGGIATGKKKDWPPKELPAVGTKDTGGGKQRDKKNCRVRGMNAVPFVRRAAVPERKLL